MPVSPKSVSQLRQSLKRLVADGTLSGKEAKTFVKQVTQGEVKHSLPVEKHNWLFGVAPAIMEGDGFDFSTEDQAAVVLHQAFPDIFLKNEAIAAFYRDWAMQQLASPNPPVGSAEVPPELLTEGSFRRSRSYNLGGEPLNGGTWSLTVLDGQAYLQQTVASFRAHHKHTFYRLGLEPTSDVLPAR
jgi:hypothetical protein